MDEDKKIKVAKERKRIIEREIEVPNSRQSGIIRMYVCMCMYIYVRMCVY